MTLEQFSFLNRHSRYAFSCISDYYPLNWDLLERYRNTLNWELIGQNERITWSASLIEDFFPQLTQETGKFSVSFCLNPTLPWSVEFIKRYQPYWNWEGLAENEVVINDKGILIAFHSELDRIIRSLQPSSTAAQLLLSPIDYSISRYDEEPWLLYTTEEEIDRDPNIEWHALSWSEFLPWSAEFIKRYEDKWDWESLCCNSLIHWTDEMIEEFKDKLFWGYIEHETCQEHGQTIHSGLTNSIGRKWTPSQVERFKDRIDWFSLSVNDQIFDWTMDLLVKYENHIDFSGLVHNQSAWQTCFGTLTDEDVEILLNHHATNGTTP